MNRAYLAVEGALQNAARRGWPVATFKRVSAQEKRPNLLADQPLLSLASTGDISVRGGEDGLGRQAPSKKTILDYWKVTKDQVVVNPMWLVGGSVGVSQTSGAVSPAYRVYGLAPNVHPRYVHHLLRSSPYLEQYRLLGRGDTTFDRSVGREDFEGLPIPLPSLEEQRSIARFLDHQVALLDRAIMLRKQQMDLLTERDRADLEAAVDRLTMKFGNIAIRRLAIRIEQGTSPDCYGYPAEPAAFGVLKVSAVKDGRFSPSENKALPDTVEPDMRYLVSPGDVLLTRGSGSRALVGTAALVDAVGDSQLLLPDLLYRLVLKEDVDPAFVVACLLSPRLRSDIGLATRGAIGGTIKLRGGDILELRVPAADGRAQRDMGHAFRLLRSAADRRNSLMAESLGLLQERKQALITAAVTGEFDVTTARKVA